MAKLQNIVNYTNQLLDIEHFEDYCPNGLQVEGKVEVQTLISGVTASQAFLETAILAGADALLVHHGYFWKGEDQVICGMKKMRLACLLAADVSLLAYHLPLDAHALYGNNTQLGRVLGFNLEGTLNSESRSSLLVYGTLPVPRSPRDLSDDISAKLHRSPLHIPGKASVIRKVAWCTGAAQSYIEQAVSLGVDAFISGEVSEQTVHIAREMGIHYYAAGHHATERYGVQALGAHLAVHFGITHRYIDVDNPV